MLVIIIIGLIFIILFALISHNKKTNRIENIEYRITSKCNGKVTTTIGKVIPSHDTTEAELRKRTKKQKLSRFYRLERHKHTWAVIRYMKTLNEVYDSANFYDLDKAINEFKDSINRLKESDYNPSITEIATAVRFCGIKYTKGECEHEISKEEEAIIYNWKVSSLDSQRILSNTSNQFKSYWDNVILGYKRESAKRNRIEYLINHLNDMKNRESLSELPDLNKYIDGLIQYYNSVFEQ